MNNIIAECPAIFNLRGRDGGRDCDYPVAGVTLSQKAGVQALPLIRRGETCPLRPSQATAACETTRPVPVGLIKPRRHAKLRDLSPSALQCCFWGMMRPVSLPGFYININLLTSVFRKNNKGRRGQVSPLSGRACTPAVHADFRKRNIFRVFHTAQFLLQHFCCCLCAKCRRQYKISIIISFGQ